MQLKRLNSDLSVSPQIEPSDIEKLAALGYRSIIGNRPDGEAPDQPDWASIKAAATARGMEAVHIPVVASQITDADIDKFRTAMEQSPKPIAAFCRTGTRSALLWALVNAGNLTVDERISIAAAEGYDLTPFREQMASADLDGSHV